MSGAKVITTRNVYTGRVMDLCAKHYAEEANGDAQVNHGMHFSLAGCSACNAVTTAEGAAAPNGADPPK